MGEKLSNLSTASFSLSTFRDHGDFEESTTTNGKFSYSDMVQTNIAINGTGPSKRFQPLTPQDLMQNLVISDVEPVESVDSEREHINEHSSLDRTLPIMQNVNSSMDDMELDDLNDDDHEAQVRNLEFGGQESSNYSVANDTTRANGKFSSVGSASMNKSIPFRFNYDSANSNDGSDDGMSLHDLETVKEEQSKNNYAMFVGLDSDATDDTSQNT